MGEIIFALKTYGIFGLGVLKYTPHWTLHISGI